MSVVIEIFIFPMDKGESVSHYMDRALTIIQDCGFPYAMKPMGTCIEGEWNEVMPVVDRCFQDLQTDCNRIHMTLKADYRKGTSGRIKGKVKSVRSER